MVVSSRLVRISPTQAERWLEGNVLNRTIKDKTVRNYAEMMKRNMWLQNGSTLVFASDGTLLDGQHRLWACIESKTPFTTLVAEGVDKETFSTIDTGVNRTAGDVLHIAGHNKHAATLAAAATHVLNYRRGDLNVFKLKVPRQDVLKFVEENAELKEFITLARSIKGSVVSKHAALVCSIGYMANRKHPQPARNFVKRFMTGEDLPAKSPILVLRNRLMNEKNMRTADRLTLAANAWNAYVTGKQITHLKLTGGNLPKIIGA